MNPYRIIRDWFRDPAYVQMVAITAVFAAVVVAASVTLRSI